VIGDATTQRLIRAALAQAEHCCLANQLELRDAAEAYRKENQNNEQTEKPEAETIPDAA